MAFMSTTLQKKVAIEYSRHTTNIRTVMKAEPSMEHRGACISWLSQSGLTIAGPEFYEL